VELVGFLEWIFEAFGVLRRLEYGEEGHGWFGINSGLCGKEQMGVFKSSV
jgi:hypothetical protein